MANKVTNIGLGRFAAYHDNVVNNTPTNSALVVVLLKASQADDALVDYTDLSSLLANAGNTEADFTNYARIVLTDAQLSASTINNTSNSVASIIPDQTITSAGGTLDNTLTKVVVCYDPDSTGGTDADLVPVFVGDFAVTTTGADLVLDFPATGYATSTSA